MKNIDVIRDHLQKNFSITTIDAFSKYQICHLAKYIQLLKNELDIKSVWITSSKKKKHFKVYFIKRAGLL